MHYTIASTSSIAAGLLSAVIALTGIIISLAIAMYGDDIRSVCRRPKVCLTLPDKCGEWTVLGSGDTAIYFHGLVQNTTLTLGFQIDAALWMSVNAKGSTQKEIRPWKKQK